VSDEWRLLIELGDEIGLHRAGDSLVTYADSSGGAELLTQRLRRELEQRGLEHLAPRIEHWDHDAQEWKRDDERQPATAGDVPSLEDEEDEEPAEASTASSWTVTVSLAHHRDAKRLAEELKSEGWSVSSSWHTLETTTRSREEAETLAAELESRAPGSDPVFWANE
jgi:hypothetical protein